MDAERWQRLSPLLDALLELEPQARVRRLQELRDEDAALADELEALIALEDEHGDFLSAPLVMPPAGVGGGSEVGPYRLERLLGEGGMGQVWLASRADGLYQRRVALKLLRPGLTSHDLRLRFTREREILARLAHPHIARLLDAGISGDGLPYLALEYVDGIPITDYCRDNRVPLAQRLDMFLQVCEAVSHAHANLIVHRDLKPSNIMVTPAGEVRLLDFGIAKLLDSAMTEGVQAPERTGTGMRAFTLHYAAPEQIRGEPVTTMTDVYSLGVVLYELLTDRRPYRLKRHSDAEWEEAILTADPVRPSASLTSTGVRRDAAPADDRHGQRRRSRALAGDLDNIALKTLAKRPEQRYPSVEALAQDIRRYRSGRPVQARPQKLGYRMRKFVARHRWALAAATLAIAVLATALTLIAWQAREAVAEAARAQAMQDFMVGLFDQARETRGGTVDLRELLTAAEARGSADLGHHPRTRAELLGLFARLRLALGDYPQAEQLLQQQAGIVDERRDIPTSLQLESLALRGQMLALQGRPQACIALMEPGLAWARNEQARLPAQSSQFHSQLGRCRRAVGTPQAARQMFERSLASRRAAGADTAGIAENMMDLAMLHSDSGDDATALRGLDEALEYLRRNGGAQHPLVVQILRSRCALRRTLGDIANAEHDCEQALALALQLHGDDSLAGIDARRQLAALRVDQGRFAEAQDEFTHTQAWLLARLGPDHHEVARDYNSLAITAWERGDLPTALHAMAQAVAIWRQDAQRTWLGAGLFNQAMVMHDAGRDVDALPLLLEARELRAAQFGATHPLIGDTDRMIGVVAAALGDTDEAKQALQRAVVLTRDGYGAAHSHTLRAELSQARLLAAEGEPRALQRLAEIGETAASDSELRKARWLGRAYLAEAVCAQEPGRARDLLDAVAEDMQVHMPEGGAVPREVEAIDRRCR